LKDKFNKFNRTIKDDLSEIKWNLKELFKKLGRKYAKRASSPSSDTSSDPNDSNHLDDSSDGGIDFAHGDSTGKGKGLLQKDFQCSLISSA